MLEVMKLAEVHTLSPVRFYSTEQICGGHRREASQSQWQEDEQSEQRG